MPKKRKGAAGGQAIVLMAVVLATLFFVFMLMFEIGRLLVARAAITSAANRAGEAAMSYLVDYAQNRMDWNQAVLHAEANEQVWQAFYDTKTGVPDWLRAQAMDYLKRNLSDQPGLVTQASIDALDGQNVVTFPYKEPNWPTGTIGIQIKVTVQVPLFFFTFLSPNSPTVPIGVQTVSIASVEEIVGVSNSSAASYGAGGSASEMLVPPQPILNTDPNWTGPRWMEPYAHFNVFHPIAQWWGCPSSTTTAYRYAQGRHAGMDIGIPEGTNLFAVADGTVYHAGFYPFQINPVGNNSVILKISLPKPDGSTATGFVTYMHMLSLNVTTGQQVKAGDLIGVSDGDPTLHPPTFTGFTSGAHLHFQVAVGSFYDYPDDVDPEWYLGLGQNDARGNVPGKGALPGPC